MNMRTQTLRQVESALKRYGLSGVVTVLTALCAFFRNQFVDVVVKAAPQTLATIVVWLAMAVLVITSVGAFYFFKSRKLEKDLLKMDPDYYESCEFNEAFDEFARKQ